MAKILVTGSTGFIGKRLIYRLLEQGHIVYALVRVKREAFKGTDPSRLHLVFGDVSDPEKPIALPEEIDAAYYLIHSMGAVVKNLMQAEGEVASAFVQAIEKTRCKQIIFLSGIIEGEKQLSPHLSSRLFVERILMKAKVPCTVLRASIIIGAGSASFEIIRDLVEKLPFMIAPRWVKSFCQPIGIRDVLFYLTGVLLNSSCYQKSFDIGGPEAMTFKDILLRYAKYRQLKRTILDVPLLTPRLSSYWLVLITSVPLSICMYLVESMRHSTRKLNTAIDPILPHECLPYEETLRLAFQKIEQNEVISSWSDAWDEKIHGDIQTYLEVPKDGCLKDTQIVQISAPPDEIQERIWSIGGRKCWYAMDWAWELRGFIDRMLGGAGLRRGRRHPSKIEPGDAIDFWRVLLADVETGHLVLYAEMKIPGEAWLEFQIDRNEKTLCQTATFRPKGFWGRAYWVLLYPFHWLIFRKMARAIAQPKL